MPIDCRVQHRAKRSHGPCPTRGAVSQLDLLEKGNVRWHFALIITEAVAETRSNGQEITVIANWLAGLKN